MFEGRRCGFGKDRRCGWMTGRTGGCAAGCVPTGLRDGRAGLPWWAVAVATGREIASRRGGVEQNDDGDGEGEEKRKAE